MSAPAPSFEQRARDLLVQEDGYYRPLSVESLAALLESVARERDALNADVVEAAREGLTPLRELVAAMNAPGEGEYAWIGGTTQVGLESAIANIESALAAHDAEREART